MLYFKSSNISDQYKKITRQTFFHNDLKTFVVGIIYFGSQVKPETTCTLTQKYNQNIKYEDI